MMRVLTTFWFLLTLTVLVAPVFSCPSSCRCTLSKGKKKDDGDFGLKVTCNRLNLTSLDKADFSLLPNDTVSLTISNTPLNKLRSEEFLGLESVTKLDLSRNKIIHIEKFAFSNMTSLKKLNLSFNSISVLGPDVFSNLPSLEKLDLKGNPLMCDCHLQWFLNWYRNNDIKVTPGSTCQYPAQLRAMQLIKLSGKDTHCDYPLQLPLFELLPSKSQLVFEGDFLTLECRISDIDGETKIVWLQDSHRISDELDATLEIERNRENGLVTSYLSLDLILNHTGSWMCRAVTKRGNLSRTVKIVVVSQKTPPCQEEITIGNKGQYHWPQTLGGILVELPCVSLSPAVLAYKQPHVYRTCSMGGIWEEIDASECPYVSEVTNILEQFAKTNLSESKTVLDTARGLRNYTGNGSSLTDHMDLVYITQTLENYLALVPQHKELGEILLDVISAILGRDKTLLKLAQEEDKTRNKLYRLIESLATAMADSSIHHSHPNLLVEEFLVKSESFPGMRCTAFKDSLSHWGRNLHCISVNATLPLNFDKPMEASIYVPHSIFGSSKNKNQRATAGIPTIRSSGRKLQFALYRKSILFPRPDSLSVERDVTTAVISCQTVPPQTKNLIQPLQITLQVPAYTEDAKPVRWDVNAADGKGDWTTQGCVINSVVGQSVTFFCSRLGNFGIMQDLDKVRYQLRYLKAQFRMAHPVVCVGSFICLVLLVFTIFIFCKEWKNIKMPKKMKHSLLNTWIAISALVLTFTLGIQQTDFAIVCQIVGLVIHYLTLCTLVWMIITANNMYKHLTRHDPIDLPPDEPPPDPTVPPKPMMQFYLVGWGIGTIICGISAAVHLNAYHNPSFCFLSKTSSLAAFYGPVVVFVTLLFIYFLLIRCHYSREIETSGVLLVGSPTNTNADTDSLIDLEFNPSSQLRALFVLWFLFVSAWTLAAFSVARLFPRVLPPYDAVFFGLFYFILSVLLGVFVFCFYIYFRNDLNLRLKWWLYPSAANDRNNSILNLRKSGNSPIVNITENLVETLPQNPAVQVDKLSNAIALPPRDVVIDNARCHVNLLSSHASATPPNNCGVELFYNPRQSIVAKKFFEKNRRQQQLKSLQKNNLAKAQTSFESEHFIRTRAYSDTEKASTYRSAGDEEKSQLCTSQSYSGAAAIATRSDHFKDNPPKTALNVQNGLVEIHPEPDHLVKKPSSPTKINSQEYYQNVSKNCSKPVNPQFSTTTNCERSSCSECSKCHPGKPRSLCSQSCYSDFTSVSQNAQKRRSRSGRSKWRKNSRQYSWDDKYDNRAKVFIPPSPSSPGPMSAEMDIKISPVPVSRSNSKRKQKRRGDTRGSNRSRDRSFARSQSAYEQMAAVNSEKLISDDDQLVSKPLHQETRM